MAFVDVNVSSLASFALFGARFALFSHHIVTKPSKAFIADRDSRVLSRASITAALSHREADATLEYELQGGQ